MPAAHGAEGRYVWQVFRGEPCHSVEPEPVGLAPAVGGGLIWRLPAPGPLVSAVILVVLAATVALVWCLHDLPPLNIPARPVSGASITVLARDGRTLAETGDQYGEDIAPDRLPPALVAAVIATEDRRFLHHGGVDPLGIARAFLLNLRAGAVEQGGSTITQQVAKMLFLSPERTVKRKVQEIVLATELERRYSKAEILALYLNRAYFGGGAYGADAAARRFFGKPVSELDVAEAAVLAGALKAPSRFNLFADRDAAIRRADSVLAAMLSTGVLPTAAAAAAGRRLNHIAARAKPAAGSYFADWVIDSVRGMPETWGRHVIVTTTLDADLQRTAEARMRTLLDGRGARDGASQGALVVMTPEGEVRAMIGGRDYDASPFNRAVQAQRQPGSTFKMFVFLAAMEGGASPDDTVLDAPVRMAGWAPENYRDRYAGTVTLRTAFAQSLNSAAVRVAARSGIAQVVRVARRLGIQSKLGSDATLALGSSEVNLLELTAAAATLGAGGIAPDVTGIAEVHDATGAVLYRHDAERGAPVVDPNAVAKMQDVMSEVVRSGTGKAARLDRPAAGKTGTSQDYRDAWFVGFTGNLVAGVWLGNDDGTPMKSVTGGTLAASLWHDVMATAHAGLPAHPLRGADPLVAAASGAVPHETEEFLRVITGWRRGA